MALQIFMISKQTRTTVAMNAWGLMTLSMVREIVPLLACVPTVIAGQDSTSFVHFAVCNQIALALTWQNWAHKILRVSMLDEMTVVHTFAVKLHFTCVTYKFGLLMNLFMDVSCHFHSPVGQTGTKATHKQFVLVNFVCTHIFDDAWCEQTVCTLHKCWSFPLPIEPFLHTTWRRLGGHNLRLT